MSSMHSVSSNVLSTEAWVHAKQGSRGHNSGTLEWTSGLPQDIAVWICAHEPDSELQWGGKKTDNSSRSKKNKCRPKDTSPDRMVTFVRTHEALFHWLSSSWSLIRPLWLTPTRVHASRLIWIPYVTVSLLVALLANHRPREHEPNTTEDRSLKAKFQRGREKSLKEEH